eukprot:5746153-Pyramimonas_sp.AAC.1
MCIRDRAREVPRQAGWPSVLSPAQMQENVRRGKTQTQLIVDSQDNMENMGSGALRPVPPTLKVLAVVSDGMCYHWKERKDNVIG